MLDLIRRHNRLNGIWFSIGEFVFIFLAIGGLGTAHLVLGNFTLAIIEWGIAVNCFPVVVIGVRMLMDRGETGKATGYFWNKQAREQLKRDNPHMLRDTLTLTAATLIPFVLLILVVYQLVRSEPPANLSP